MKEENQGKTRNKVLSVFFKLIIIAIFLCGILFVLKIAPNYIKTEITDKTNLVINYTNVTGKTKQDMIIDNNGVIYLSMDDIKNYYDKHIYYDKQYNQIVTSSETKLAVLEIGKNEITINGEKSKIKGCAKLENNIYYLPISEMEKVYNIKISNLENTIVIESLDNKLKVAKVNKKTAVKYKTTYFSKNIEKVAENDKLVIAEVTENTLPTGWVKVRTQNGKIGYIE